MKSLHQLRRSLAAVAAALVAFLVAGFTSNLIESRALEDELRETLLAQYGEYRSFWLEARPEAKGAKVPTNLPESLEWVPSGASPPGGSASESGYDRYSIRPWASTERRWLRFPFWVQVNFAYQWGPLKGMSGGEAYWSVFGLRGGRKIVIGTIQ